MVKIIAVIAMLCMVISEGFAYDLSYPSFFAISKRDLFCSDKAQINGIPGVPGVGGCVDPARFSYAENRTGFKVRNDPTDARIVCGIDYTSTALCTQIPKTLTFSDNVKSATIFRIYVPIGTIAVRVTLQVPSQMNIAAIAQFGQPPSYSPADYFSISGKSPSLKDFSTSARAVGNSDGLIYLINDTNISSDNSFISNLSVQDRFLYVKVIDYSGGGYVQSVNYSITVDYAQYLAWYGTMDWASIGEEGIIPDIIPPGAESSSGTFTGTGTPGQVIDVFGASGGTSGSPGTGSSNSTPSPPIIGAGTLDLAAMLASSLHPQTTTTPVIPIFDKPIQAQKAADFTGGPIQMTWSQPTVDLKPALNIEQQPDFPIGKPVNVYAAYIDCIDTTNKQICQTYVANSNSVFQIYVGGTIPVFRTTTIRSDATVWPLDSEKVNLNPFCS